MAVFKYHNYTHKFETNTWTKEKSVQDEMVRTAEALLALNSATTSSKASSNKGHNAAVGHNDHLSRSNISFQRYKQKNKMGCLCP